MFSMPDSLTSVGGSDYMGWPLTCGSGGARRVHSRFEVAWRDSVRLASAQLPDHGQNVLLGQDAFAFPQFHQRRGLPYVGDGQLLEGGWLVRSRRFTMMQACTFLLRFQKNL